MGTLLEYGIILGVTSTLAASAVAFVEPKLEAARAKQALVATCMAGDGSAPRLYREPPLRLRGPRYGWGFVNVTPGPEAMCGALREGALWLPAERRARPTTPAEAAFVGGGFAAMLALAARQARSRYLRLCRALGFDEPAPEPPPAGLPYRAQASTRTRRRLRPEDARAFALRVAVGLGAWAASTLAVAFFANGASPAPMPLVTVGWAALLLPPAITFLRWRNYVWWAPTLSALAALFAALKGAFFATLPLFGCLVLFTLFARLVERDTRARGRLP